MAGFYQKHDPDAEHHASHEADQESEKEFSSHRGDHGEPDAPLLIVEGGAGAFRRLSVYQKRAALAMDRAPIRREDKGAGRLSRRKKKLLARLLSAGLAVTLQAVEVHAD